MRKILKIGFLLLIREAYLSAKNLLGLIYHPFLTLREIKVKKDRSQTILLPAIVSTPLLLLGFISLVYLFAKYHIGLSFPSPIGFFIKSLDLAIFFFTGIVFFHLLYWTFKVIKKNRFGRANVA